MEDPKTNNSEINDVPLFRAIRSTLYVDSLIYFIIAMQYLIYPLVDGVIFIDDGFFIFLFFLFNVISFFLAKNYDKKPNAIFNLLWLLINFAVSFMLFLFFSGWLTPILNILTIIMTCLNGFSLILNLLFITSKKGYLLLKSYTFSKKSAKSKIITIIFIILVIGSGVGSFMSWGVRYTIKADDDFKTISSYWGPPARDESTYFGKITPIDVSTLQIDNSTLNEIAPNFGVDSLCYIKNVTYGGGNMNYCDYLNGARSYPNGTVFLSQPLPATDNVTIEFVYRNDEQVFRDLFASNSTLIMNYLNSADDFIDYQNIFMRIERTYLFQLLDWWGVKYYLDVGIRELSFPNIFNYPEFVDLSYRTLEWANNATVGEGGPRALTEMVGISLDFESGNKSNPDYNPMQNWDLQPPFILSYNDWIGANEQNRTLYEECIEAYEGVYSKCSEYGFKFYAVFQGNAMMEIMDNDLDSTRLPTYPISPNPDVLYGIMAYHDNNFDTGRYGVYKDCTNQIKLYGDQGKTILLGWLSQEAKYYSPDEEGLEHYIEDCKIAQAAGMVEIFHAPLYRMQGMWGNEAILRLHNELNNQPKETIIVEAPKYWDYDPDLMNDYVQNFDRLYYFVLMVVFIGVIFYYNLIRQKSEKVIND